MIRHTSQRKRNKKKYILRKFLLLIEAAVLSLFFIGGSEEGNFNYVRSEVLAKENEKSAAETEEEHKETPAFRWEDHQVIAHALGAVDGRTYLNSKESFLENYEKGYRLFEVDLTKTSDGVWVCRHSWNDSMGQWEGEEKQVLSLEDFLSSPLYGKYTPMTFQDLLELLKEYPDVYVLLDSKQYSVRNYQRTLEDYSEYVEIAGDANAEEVLSRLIPEIYNEAMYPGVAAIKRFSTYIYSLWQEYSLEELEEIAAFCREKEIPAATVYEEYWSPKVQRIFDKQGILLYIYTVNNVEKAKTYMESGAAGICTDMITQERLSLG